MFGLDPLSLVVMGVGLALSLAAQVWVHTAVSRLQSVALARGFSGAEIAALILQARGIHGVAIEPVGGVLTDHYDPSTKTLRLSPDHFYGRSVAAAGIAAHEVGHALQDADGYGPMQLRQRMVPVAQIGTNLGVLLVGIGASVGALGLAKLGVVLFAGFVAFTLVTLPVEIDASRRALRALASTGLLDDEELDGVRRVLTAAAATYVAAALSAVLQLLYFVLRVSGRHRDE